MTKRNYQRINAESYNGKILEVKSKEVIASLFTPEEEIVGMLPRVYFPSKIEIGNTFKYKFAIRISINKPKKISNKESKKIKENLERELGSFDLSKRRCATSP